MTPPRVIELEEFEAPIPRDGNGEAGTGPRVRRRWRARVAGGRAGAPSGVGGTHAAAIGDLVYRLAAGCDTAEDVLDLVAALFGDVSVRPAAEALGRAVWFAARHPGRKHPGVTLRVRPLASAKGGAS